jgi:hypothetical protein
MIGMKRALIVGICGLLAWAVIPYPTYADGPTIADVTAVSSTVGRFDPFVLTFSVGSTATNPDFPYDSDPPAGVPAGVGITVDGLFSPDNWTTVYTQPAFLYQPYTYTVRGFGSQPRPSEPGATAFRPRMVGARPSTHPAAIIVSRLYHRTTPGFST